MRKMGLLLAALLSTTACAVDSQEQGAEDGSPEETDVAESGIIISDCTFAARRPWRHRSTTSGELGVVYESEQRCTPDKTLSIKLVLQRWNRSTLRWENVHSSEDIWRVDEWGLIVNDWWGHCRSGNDGYFRTYLRAVNPANGHTVTKVSGAELITC